MADSLALQTSDGEMHTIVLTPEQLAELGLQIQYPPVTVVTESIPIQNLEIIPCETRTEPIMVPNNIKMHKSIRLSNIKLSGNSYKLITDRGVSSTITDSCNGEPEIHTNVIKMSVDDVDKLIPITNILTAKNNVSLINHNRDIISSNDIVNICEPINIDSDDDIQVKSVKTISLNSRISKLDPTVKNGKRARINFGSISNDAKRQANSRTSLTPIPLAPKPQKKMLIQADTTSNIGWNKGSTHQTVYVLQTGDKYHSVEKLDGEKLRVVTDAVNSVVAKPENKNNVLFDPVSKTRILYRVLNPEDLNLCNPSEVQEKNTLRNIMPKKSKSKTLNQSDAGNQKVLPVTRSGRCVRPPRHRTNGAEKKNLSDREDDNSMDIDADPFDNEIKNLSNKANVRQRMVCPFCKKTYHTMRRMARHLSTFPEHAINQKCVDLLEKFKLENQTKKPTTIDAESQTDFLPNVPLNSESSQPKCIKKDAMTDGVNINTYREREDRSLFKGLLRILQRTSAECRAYVFIRQIALLTAKLRKLLPCLLHRTNNSSACLINEAVGRILDLTPGKYHLDMDAIHCAKIQNGTCKHTQTLIDTIIPDDPSISFNNSWINTKNNDCHKNDKNPLTKCARTNPVEKWTQNVPKRKWIPIGSDNNANDSSADNEQTWMPTNCNILTSNSTYVQTDEPIKTWDTALRDANAGNDASANNSWISNIPKIDMTQKLAAPNHILNPTQTNLLHSTKNNRLNFDCKDKLVGLHSNLVFDIDKEIIPMDLKSCDSQSVNQSTEPENFDFNDSRFDMQLDSDKLNFTSAQYNEMKYGRDTLPPFRKIEPSKNIALPVDSLSDISSDADKLHLPSDDSILGGNNYPITTESLELSELNPCKAVAMDSNEGGIHCSEQQLLESADLNLPISVSDTLNRNEAMLSVSESSLDGTRLSLTGNQSVLNLLDPLGTDCLSFADSELNPRASQMSLDLQLDLFPFHHP